MVVGSPGFQADDIARNFDADKVEINKEMCDDQGACQPLCLWRYQSCPVKVQNQPNPNAKSPGPSRTMQKRMIMSYCSYSSRVTAASHSSTMTESGFLEPSGALLTYAW